MRLGLLTHRVCTGDMGSSGSEDELVYQGNSGTVGKGYALHRLAEDDRRKIDS